MAFVGRSGSGKSTVLNLLTRFHDSAIGTVAIDGHNIQQTSRHSLRAQMGAVFQQSYLFDTTLRENIRQGRLDADDTEVEDAARAAEIHDFIAGLPEGYDTQPGEGGGQLSGGQRQRIALARAILRDPKILLLDEATSALDPRTEAAVNATLERLAQGRTVVSVTHRLSAVTNMDRIFVLDRGAVIEAGRHKELLNLKGVYHQMWQEFALELTGNALMGEAQPTRDAPPAPAAFDQELADIDQLMDTGELGALIEQFEATEQAEQEAARERDTNQRWAQLVGTDRLTGLPNRVAFMEALVPMAIQQAQREGDPIGFLLLSADNMGVVNQEHGRNAGDHLLGELAALLQSIAKGEEALGHLDGSNFALVLHPADLDAARQRAEGILAGVAAHAFTYESATIQLTVSAGIHALDSAGLTDPKRAAEEAVTRLNDALFAAKRAGGNQVVAADAAS